MIKFFKTKSSYRLVQNTKGVFLFLFVMLHCKQGKGMGIKHTIISGYLAKIDLIIR